jgi:hypothetical protein
MIGESPTGLHTRSGNKETNCVSSSINKQTNLLHTSFIPHTTTNNCSINALHGGTVTHYGNELMQP